MLDFKLVAPEFVEQCPSGTTDSSGQPWKILEAHFSSIDHPLVPGHQSVAHIPGALQIHPSYLEAGSNKAKFYPFYDCPDDGNLMPDADLTLALQRIGITPDTPILVYGSEPDGTMAAARLIWGLLYAGVKKIRLLDGGLDAWIAHGGATVPHIQVAWFIGSNNDHFVEAISHWKTRPDLLATTEEVRGVTQSTAGPHPAAKLIDVRQRGEWDGTLPHFYPFLSKAGHIPTAIFQDDWENLVDMETHKLGPKLGAVAQRWRDQGIIDPAVETGETSLIFYCGTGWRSSISFLIAFLFGLNAKNYDGGFYAWSWNEENTIVTG